MQWGECCLLSYETEGSRGDLWMFFQPIFCKYLRTSCVSCEEGILSFNGKEQ